MATRDVLRTVSKKEARRCIIIRQGFVRTCEVYPDGNVKRYLLRKDSCDRIMEGAANSELICICNDASSPGYAVAAYNMRRGCWERFESDIARVAKLEPFYRERLAG